MRRTAFVLMITTAIVALTAGCDEPITNHPTGPNSTAPAVNGVEINGPATLAPGQSARFTASIRLADGSLKTAEPNAIQRWRIGNPSLLQADHFGIMTAQPRAGETTVSVDVRVGTAVRTATREVVILPEGTFRVVGRIAEAGFPTQGVGGAKVEVAGSEISTTSDFLGQYRLYGVPASAVIRVTASGYAPLEEAVSLTTNTTRNFPLDLDGIRPTVSGPYTLAIDVVSSCPNGPIPDLQHRRYDAFLTANGPNIDVELTEPRFRLNSLGRGNKFTGRTIGNGVMFTLRPYAVFAYYYYYYVGPTSYPDVAERLSDNSFLVIEGTAATNLTGSTLSGLLSGSLTNWDRRFPSVQTRLSSCAGNHQFVLSPR